MASWRTARVPRRLPWRRLGSFVRPRSRGQAMVEFVLILPVMFLLIGAAVDLGRLFYSNVAVDNAAKEGALAGARSPLCDAPGLAVCTDPNNVVWHVNHEAPNLVDGSGNSLMSTTVACRKPDGTLVQSITDCLDGYTYQVTVSMPFRLVTPLISALLPSTITLSKEAQSTVIIDAYDPSGLEVLLWASKANSLNPSDITSNCTQADPVFNPDYYFQPCQDSLNRDHNLQFNEGDQVSYAVRVKNTGNIGLTGISYAFTENGAMLSVQGNCNTLPVTLAPNQPPVYCTFTRPAFVSNPLGGINDDVISIRTNAFASGLPAGSNATSTDIKVVPAPRLVVSLQTAPWRLGGTTGNGSSGNPWYADGNLTLNRDTAASSPEIQNPTGWLYLKVQNKGGPANNFSASVTRAGSPVNLTACNVPPSLAITGQPGDTFTCLIPQSFTTNGTTAFAASASATNAQLLGGQQTSLTVTTAPCSSGKVVPNLVDTLSPAANGSDKTLSQAQSLWSSAGFTGPFTATPVGALGTDFVSAQSVTPYTCLAPSTGVTVAAAP